MSSFFFCFFKLRANILSPLTDTVTLDGRLDVVR